jgi:hypothetical protein
MIGGDGDDWIVGAFVADKLVGGKGNDLILTNPSSYPDFSIDTANCVPGYDTAEGIFYSEGDITLDWETVRQGIGD